MKNSFSISVKYVKAIIYQYSMETFKKKNIYYIYDIWEIYKYT